MLSIYLYSALFNLSFFLTEILSAPKVFGGGCDIIDGILYYLGGKVYNTKSSQLELSKTVYSLNLTKGFELDQGLYAPWVPIENLQSPEAYLPEVIAHKRSKRIFMFGGMEVSTDLGTQVFDTVNKEWKKDQNITSNYPKFYINNEDATKYTRFSSKIVKDDLDENIFYSFGGLIAKNDLSSYISSDYMMVYNVKDNSWFRSERSGMGSSAYTSQFYKDKIYVIGGFENDGAPLTPMDLLMVYDTISLKWKNFTIKGELPSRRFGLSSVMVGSQLYILSGTKTREFDQYPSSDLFYIDLSNAENYSWIKVPINGYISSSYGCLAYYNDHIIYSFGFYKKPSDTTQIINIKTKKLVKVLPSIYKKGFKQDDDWVESSTPNKDEFQPNIPIIVGLSVGGFLLFIIIIISVWVCIKYKNKQARLQNQIKNEAKHKTTLFKALFPFQAEYQPPSLDQDNIWSYKNNEAKKNNFILDYSTSMPNN